MFATSMHPDRKLAMVAVDNVGAYAASALIHPEKYIDHEIELAGDEISFPNAFSLISQVIGKEIQYRQLPQSESEKVFGHDFGVMFNWFEEVGYNPNITFLEKEYGIPLLRFKDYIKNAPWLIQFRPEVKTR
jgi:hypothetical protein